MLGDRREFWQGYKDFVITTQKFLLWKRNTEAKACERNGHQMVVVQLRRMRSQTAAVFSCTFAWFKQHEFRDFSSAKTVAGQGRIQRGLGRRCVFKGGIGIQFGVGL